MRQTIKVRPAVGVTNGRNVYNRTGEDEEKVGRSGDG